MLNAGWTLSVPLSKCQIACGSRQKKCDYFIHSLIDSHEISTRVQIGTDFAQLYRRKAQNNKMQHNNNKQRQKETT